MNCCKHIPSTVTMKRISRQELADKLDDILNIVGRDNVGFVITDEGKNDLVLCPADWYCYCFDDDFSCILNNAVKFSLGQNTYIPDTVSRFVTRYLTVLESHTIIVMIRDLEEALKDKDLPCRETWAFYEGQVGKTA